MLQLICTARHFQVLHFTWREDLVCLELVFLQMKCRKSICSKQFLLSCPEWSRQVHSKGSCRCHLNCSGFLQRSIAGTGDPAWAARYGGGGPRSRYTQAPPSPLGGASVGRVGPRTYHISNQQYGTVSFSYH